MQNDNEQNIADVLSHAALGLMVLDADTADRVRRALRSEAIDDPALANDPDRVGRLVERYVKAIGTNEVQPLSEL